jgi:hypothetical protein
MRRVTGDDTEDRAGCADIRRRSGPLRLLTMPSIQFATTGGDDSPARRLDGVAAQFVEVHCADRLHHRGFLWDDVQADNGGAGSLLTANGDIMR